MEASDDNPLGISILKSCSPFPVPYKDLPPKLWHVQHGHSQSFMTYDGGFIADAGYRTIRDDADHKLQASRHFDWETHLYEETLGWKSCFISAFGDRRHAENWGRKRDGPVAIYEIDATKLTSSTLVFDAVKLCDLLHIDHPLAKDEFMFLHGIPGHCVDDQYQLSGGQYIRRPNWRITDIPSRDMSLGFRMLGTLPIRYPTSQSCHESGGLPSQPDLRRPVESAKTEDDLDSLISSFDGALHLNKQLPASTSNTPKIQNPSFRREGRFAYIIF